MLDNNSSVDMVYLDFSKAFDKVDHGILLHKLRAVGITGNIGIWLFHFLTDRSNFVRLPGGMGRRLSWPPIYYTQRVGIHYCYGHKINLPRFNDLLISEARNQQQRQEYV